MVTIKTKRGNFKKFNLKNFSREKSLFNAWKAMHGEEKYKDKKIKVTGKENFIIRIEDIEECTIDESIYATGEVR